MKIVVGVNTLTSVTQQAYANHCQLWYRLGKTHPNDNIYLFAPQRMSIDRMRNEAAKFALEIEADYLVFLDDDVLVPFDGLHKLINSNFSVCAGITLIRGYPFYPMLFDFKTDPNCHYIVDWKERGGDDVVEVQADAVGFSFCAIEVALLRKLTKPYFMTGPNFTEDVYFCQKLNRELGENFIGYHKEVVTMHILGPDLIAPSIRDARIAFEEECDPGILEKKKELDRSQGYLDEVKNIVS
jgi:hypothetical protein